MSEHRFDEMIDSYIKHAGREMLLKLAEEAPSEEELAQVCDASDALDKMIMAVIDKEVEKNGCAGFCLLQAKQQRSSLYLSQSAPLPSLILRI